MSAADEPIVVACVPAWNAAGFIARTIAALQRQDYPRLRILISDDASDDATAAICAARAEEDGRIRLLRQEGRRGWVGNCNVLLAAAEGELAFFAPHDDVPEPGYVSRMVAAMRANPRASLAFGDVRVVGIDGQETVASYADLQGIAEPAARALRVVRARLAGNRWFVCYRGMFRLGAARAAGGLRTHLAGEFAADWPWLLALAIRGEVIRVPETMYVKYVSRSGRSQSWKGWKQVVRHAGAAWGCAQTLQRSGLDGRVVRAGEVALAAGVLRTVWDGGVGVLSSGWRWCRAGRSRAGAALRSGMRSGRRCGGRARYADEP